MPWGKIGPRRQGSIAPPGSIAATPIKAPVKPEEGYPLEAPLVFFYGSNSAAQNPKLCKHQVERMAVLLDRRANRNPGVAASGLFVNTMGWVANLGYELLLHSIRALKVDNVLVVGHPTLHGNMKKDLKKSRNPSVQVSLLQKSGGVVARTPEARRADRANRVRDYFYGMTRNLVPHSDIISATELSVYEAGTSGEALDGLKVSPVRIGNEHSNRLLGVSHARTVDEILSVSVAGFIFIVRVEVGDDGERTVTYVAPSPGALPGRYLLLGAIEVPKSR